jgi:LacI family transcriptional regulator
MPSSTTTTRRQIAREAKLSTTTVSLVLNHRADAVGIKPETQRRVWEVAKRLNYIPNPLAVGLNGGRTHTIGLLWALGGPHAAGEMTHDITWRMQKHGYLTHLAEHGDDPAITEKLLVDFRRRHVDAIILQNGNGKLESDAILRELEGFSAVLMVSSFLPREGLKIDHLCHDRLPAFMEAADHFARAGRRRPGFIGNWPSAQSKAEAFLNQARRHGMEVGADAAIDLGRSAKNVLITRQCQEAMARRFDGRDFPFDALMATSDEMAVVAIAYLRGRGLRVPEDVAVVGFNDSLLAPYQVPPLASGSRQDGAAAAAIERMLLARLDQPDLPPQRRRIRMRFVWRESAGGISYSPFQEDLS